LRRRNGNGNGKHPGAPIWIWLLTFAGLCFMTLIIIGGGAAFAVYQHYASDLKPPDEALAESGSAGSRVYDRNGTQLYEFVDPLSGLSNPVPLSEISPWLIQATVSTEDASFYENPGVNVRGLVRAAMENLTPFGPGWFEGSGGSSITQQLVKNVYIPEAQRQERSIGRKIKEVILALELKRDYSDDQILEWYLNQIFYGNFAIGAEAASYRYFGKPARDLTLGEAAMLAGIPQAPGDYTPVIEENRPAAIERQHHVLDLMVSHSDELQRQGYSGITQEQAEAAKAEVLSFANASFPILAPHFVFYVKDTVAKMCERGMLQVPEDTDCQTLITRGGLRIYTTLDLPLQQEAEAIIEETIAANENRFNGHNAASVVMVPATGEILAMVGSRDYFREDIAGEVNVTTSERSPGSTIKMFTYLTAFLQGWTPASIVRDEPIDIKSEAGRPIQNWNFKFMGPITVRKALSESVNIAAVRTILSVGIENVIDTAHKLGITSLNDPGRYGPALTIGGGEVRLLDLTYAYSVIAQNGSMRGMPSVEDLPNGYRQLDPVPILRIENSLGVPLFEYKQADAIQVVPAPYAYLITDILSKSGIQWTGLTISRTAAAKTGTSENFKDALVVGYTPDRVVGVWMGNSDGTPMAEGTFSFAGAGPIWKQIMEAAHEGVEVHEFTVPEGVVFKPCAGRNEAFVEGTECTYYVPPAPEGTPAPTPGVRPTPPSGTPGAPDETPPPEEPQNGQPTPVATEAPAEPGGPEVPPKPTPAP
jgi:membrane peptidoglycan carboxypeptidase